MWLTWWTQDLFHLPQPVYSLLYLLSSMLYASCTFATALIFAYVGIYGSRNIHIALLKSVLSNKMSFFDTTPVGRIINRFAKDMAAVDERLGMQFNQVIGMTVQMLQVLVVISVITGPIFLVAASPIMWLYYQVSTHWLTAATHYAESPCCGCKL